MSGDARMPEAIIRYTVFGSDSARLNRRRLREAQFRFFRFADAEIRTETVSSVSAR